MTEAARAHKNKGDENNVRFCIAIADALRWVNGEPSQFQEKLCACEAVDKFRGGLAS